METQTKSADHYPESWPILSSRI